MLEMLVIFSCLNNTGCSETSGAYYLTRPDIKERVEFYEYKFKQKVGEHVVSVTIPMLMVSAGYDGSLKITKYVSIKGSDRWQKSQLVYSYSF